MAGFDMHIKIHGGTPRTDEASLCDSCRHSRVTRGSRIDEELVLCEASQMQAIRITFKVTSCSHYTDERFPTYYELLHQAWIFQPASRRKAAGFVRAADLRQAEVAQCLSELREDNT